MCAWEMENYNYTHRDRNDNFCLVVIRPSKLGLPEGTLNAGGLRDDIVLGRQAGKCNCNIIYDIGNGRLWHFVTGLINVDGRHLEAGAACSKDLGLCVGWLVPRGECEPTGSQQFGSLMIVVRAQSRRRRWR